MEGVCVCERFTRIILPLGETGRVLVDDKGSYNFLRLLHLDYSVDITRILRRNFMFRMLVFSSVIRLVGS